MAATELINLSLFSDANLQAYYRFNTGALTTDSKASYTLTNNNTVGETASGKFGYAADFGSSNTNKYFSIANSLGIDGDPCSFSCWVKIRTEPATNTAFGITTQQNSNTKTRNTILYEDNSGTKRLVFRRARNGIAFDSFTYNVTLGTTEWHNVVYTYDGTNVKGYLDGVYLNAVASSGNGNVTSQNNFDIGVEVDQNGGISSYASSYVDDVVVFNRALTANEVAQIYKSGAGALFFAQY